MAAGKWIKRTRNGGRAGVWRRTAWTAVVLAAIAIPFRATPQTPQDLVGSQIRISTALSSEINADVAYDSVNDRFMVVWQMEPPDYGIAAAIYNSDGTVFAQPYYLYSVATNSIRPKVAFASNFGYLVVWEDDSVGGRDILALTVSPSGLPFQLLNPSRSNSAVQAVPVVTAVTASDFLVLWEDGRNGNVDIYAQAVVNGQLYGNNNIQVTGDPRPDRLPAIASAQNGFCVLMWQRDYGTVGLAQWDVLAGVVAADGRPVGSECPIGVALYQQQAPAISFDPEHGKFLAVWEFGWSLTDIDIVGALVTVDFGTPLFQWDPLVIFDSYQREIEPAVAYDDAHDQFLVVWDQDVGNTGDRDIVGRYVSAAGANGPLENVATNYASSQMVPSLAFGSTRDQFWVAWDDNRSIQYDIYSQRTAFIPAILTVTSPNGGEVWTAGSNYPITWTSSGGVGATVDIELERAGAFLATIVASTANDGAFDWTIPASQASATNYRVRIRSESTSTTDVSDADFSITGPTQPLQMVSPNGGESWQVGTAHSITWTGDSCGSVRLELWKAGVLDSTIIASTANDGSHTWTIPAGQTVAGDYRVRVICTTDAANWDESDGAFSIVSGPTPTITVTSPNGGESWTRGNTYPITWSATAGVGAAVKIELLRSGALDSTIAASATNSGRYDWAIPSGQTSASDYRVRVSDAAAPTVSDESDGNFSIVPGGVVIPPTVVSPNGGEVWSAGSAHQIQWSPGTTGGTVQIALLKGAALDRILAASSSNTGSYTWLIAPTQAPGTDYRISIVSNADPLQSDISDGFFTIVTGGSLRVVLPNGGEIWRAGETRNIGWIPDASPAVGIELLKGGALQSIVTPSTANDGSLSWPIPSAQPPGTDYRIRVYSTSTPSVEDTSDGDFTITPPPLPNLRLEGLNFSPQVLNGGDPIHFSGRIINRGDGTVTSNFWVEFRVSGQIDFSEPTLFLCDSEVVLAPMVPGEALDLATLNKTVYTHAQNLPDGAYFVGIRMDVLNQVGESDETDNTGWLPQKMLYVGPRPTRVGHWSLYR